MSDAGATPAHAAMVGFVDSFSSELLGFSQPLSALRPLQVALASVSWRAGARVRRRGRELRGRRG